MNGMRQAWLVAKREMRERSRSRAFLASVVLMIVAVTAMLILPALLTPGGAKDVGLTGPAPTALAAAISQQAHAAGTTARVHRYGSLAGAAAAGISPGAVAALLAPMPLTSVELGPVAGRSPADETAVVVMTGVLLFGISVFGQMVLTGVLEKKASRVVEVLLARIPARSLLAGKIAGIGLLGLAQSA